MMEENGPRICCDSDIIPLCPLCSKTQGYLMTENANQNETLLTRARHPNVQGVLRYVHKVGKGTAMERLHQLMFSVTPKFNPVQEICIDHLSCSIHRGSFVEQSSRQKEFCRYELQLQSMPQHIRCLSSFNNNGNNNNSIR